MVKIHIRDGKDVWDVWDVWDGREVYKMVEM